MAGTTSTAERLAIWPLRIWWIALPVTAGIGFDRMLATFDDRVALVAEIGLWACWFVGLVSLLAPSTVALTALRLVAPSLAASAGWAVVATGGEEVAGFVSLVVTLVAVLLSLLTLTGDVMVNGSSYGPERRLALQPPAALLLGPVQLTWLLMYVGLAGGAVALAAERWLVGIPLIAVGAVVAWFGVRSLHGLSRRWIVFVPAGLVIHDSWSLAESILLRRTQIEALGPLPLDVGNLLDLSGGARGLALLVETDAPVPVALRAKREVQTMSVDRLVITPSLPGQLLHEARVRGVRIP